MSPKDEDFIRFYRDAVIAGHNEPAAETMRHFDNDIDLDPDELGRDLGVALGATLRPAILDDDVATLDPPKFAQSLHESRNPWGRRRRRGRAQEPDDRQFRHLLRARRERP